MRSPPNHLPGPRLALLMALLLVAAITLGLGLVGPSMTVVPRAGELDGWVRLLRPSMLRETSYSILSGIRLLYDHQQVGLAAVLFGFSVVFPILKLMAMGWGIAALARREPPHAAVRLSHSLGKFSMLDVLVISLLVIALKGLPGGSEIRLRWAIWCFAISVILSLIASLGLHRASQKPVR